MVIVLKTRHVSSLVCRAYTRLHRLRNVSYQSTALYCRRKKQQVAEICRDQFNFVLPSMQLDRRRTNFVIALQSLRI